MFYYKTRVGIFKIKPSNHGYGLFFNGDCIGEYTSPQSAADDVFTHTTGVYEWDMLEGRINSPTDLSEWHCV